MTNTEIQRAAYQTGAFAQDAFRHRYRELFAAFNPIEVSDALIAHLRLECSQELGEQTPNFDHYMTLLERSFLGLYDRGVIVPLVPITSLGQKAITDMRQRTQINPPGYVAPPPILTPEQRLDEQVIVDWRTLAADKIRQKKNSNPAYRDALERVLSSGELESQVTTHINITETRK